MNSFTKFLCASSAAALLLIAQGAGGQAFAQDSAQQPPKAGKAGPKPKIETFGSWTVVCSTSEKKVCVAQQQLANEKKQIVAVAGVSLSKEGGAQLMVQIPSGVIIAPGITLAVDGNDVAKAPFKACAPRGCESSFPVDQDLINTLAKGKILSAKAESVRGKNVSVDFQLDGFVDAYAAFKKGVTQ